MNRYYYRENRDAELVGPMPFWQATRGAFFLSMDKEKSGISEIVTIRGDRPGDPARAPRRLFVVRMYIRGKLVLKGRTAQYHSDNRLPPTKGGT
jgi:hypothetical protein